jgi:hypothetical protein
MDENISSASMIFSLSQLCQMYILLINDSVVMPAAISCYTPSNAARPTPQEAGMVMI